ncbi:unnamed protein product, partial [Heligmosomoides polygyrus]|uniref:NADH:ubiquinone reductase (H(+)-translocating) n=1 Tax=Heligmosomoides polygyrus TaxID=6339 RepID=A0A183F7R7_HELPZ
MAIIFILLLFLIIFLPLIKLNFLGLKFNFYFNSLLFSLILGVVTLRVLIFSTYYLDSELNFNYYYFVLLIFVGRIFILNYSNRVFIILLRWDLLDSSSGAINTALTNRVGDFFIFRFFRGSLFYGYNFLGLEYMCGFMALLLLLTSFTKSAQFPFRSWLPKAIRAPTPVSSLVHRRTLVTAGLILLMNFTNLLLNGSVLIFILLIGIFTIFFSRITALVEEDMKKVVALSTLSQIGFSMVTLGLGLRFISFIHLVRHALFKRCLFIQVGYIIHSSYGQQDGRGYGYNGNLPIFIQMQLLVTLFCLCGLIFSRGIVRKDLILELFFMNNNILIFSLLFFVSIFLTFGYSYRLFLSFTKIVGSYSTGLVMNFLSLSLVILSIVFLYIILKFLFKELIYKFLVDYLAKNVIYKLKDLKFIDISLNGLGYVGFNSFGSLSYVFRNY